MASQPNYFYGKIQFLTLNIFLNSSEPKNLGYKIISQAACVLYIYWISITLKSIQQTRYKFLNIPRSTTVKTADTFHANIPDIFHDFHAPYLIEKYIVSSIVCVI